LVLLWVFFLSFIIIFLEPFDTNAFESNNKTILLLGYGVLVFVFFIIQSTIENIWYYRVHKIWVISYEIISAVLFCTILGTLFYLYNRLIINNSSYSIKSHWWFYKNIIIVFIPIFSPLFFYLRNKFGECIRPIPPSSIIITGENKNEILKIEKKELLYIKAIENYIEIFFINMDKKTVSKTFRKTLSASQQQLPFLEKCHRSYLVNTNNIKEVEGNSQNAKISIQNIEEKIPLSKSHYKNIKSKHLLS
jgi:hypothetical protein